TSDKQDTFSINVDDGHGGVTAVPVTVTISPKNTPRRSPTTRLLCWGSRPTPRPQSDADGDFLTCTITTTGEGLCPHQPESRLGRHDRLHGEQPCDPGTRQLCRDRD